MPKVSVYLSDELYREAREQKLPISTLAQQAIADALRRGHNAEWIEAERARPPWSGPEIDIQQLMDEVRDELGT